MTWQAFFAACAALWASFSAAAVLGWIFDREDAQEQRPRRSLPETDLCGDSGRIPCSANGAILESRIEANEPRSGEAAGQACPAEPVGRPKFRGYAAYPQPRR